MKIPPGRVKKILAIRNDRFGEFLLNIPAFVSLKKYFTYARLTLLVKPGVEELALRIPLVDDIIIWDSLVKHSFSEKMELLQKIKQEKFDLAVILNPSKEFNIITYIAGIAYRVGYNRKCGFLLNYKIEDRKSEGLRHEAEYNLDLIKAVGIYVDDFPDNFSVTVQPLEVSQRHCDCEHEVRSRKQSQKRDCFVAVAPRNDKVFPIDELLHFPLDIREDDFPDSRLKALGIENGDFLVVHPWASNKEKEWPQPKFRELIKALAKDWDAKLIAIGGSEEMARSFEFCKDLPVVNLTGKTSLIELAALLKRCKLLVSADSGPMHLAAMVGTSVVALFRKNPPSVSAKRWGPVGTGHIVIESDDIAKIEVDEVLNGIKKILP